MSLLQKASLTSGSGRWHTQGIGDDPGTTDDHGTAEAAGTGVTVPRLLLTDGPHGLRKQAEGGDPLSLDNGIPATCFPPAVTLGSTWNPVLVERVGAAIGREAIAEQVAVVLGPGVNIKRSLLCGRNFEYVSEDPVVAGRIGAALVRGLQSVGVGAALKHFAVNNQETDRLRVSADVDERTLREIYLAAFEHVVTHATPWTVMCSYNRVNGTYASEHHQLLTSILRKEWGFDGLVMSDWGAVDDRVRALAAGLDLEMPPTDTDAEVVAAVLAGRLDEEVVDRAAGRLLALVDRTRTAPLHGTPVSVDLRAHHQLARAAAVEGAVLLKNADGLLPLSPTAPQTIALIGPFVRHPRYQGSGSSRVTPTRVDVPLDAVRDLVGPAVIVETVPDDADQTEDTDAAAVVLAARADVTVLFLGLPDEAESEGFDRDDISLPADQLRLLDRVADVSDRVVVVLANGGVVSVAEWQGRAGAVLEMWLPGQAGGLAVADLLFGRANPSGRLTETIPVRLEDSPAFLHFPGAEGTVTYGEGLYVGYRHYDTLGVPVAYPFGHGLSYTTFEHTDIAVAGGSTTGIEVGVTVTNTGRVAGAEVVQVYVRATGTVPRPRHVLGGFVKVSLAPGASRRVTVPVDARSFAYWSAREHRWRTEAGEAVIEVGASSRDIRLQATMVVAGDGHLPILTSMSTVDEALQHPDARPVLLRPGGPIATMLADETLHPGHHAMLRSVPLSRVAALDPALDVARLGALLTPPQEPPHPRAGPA